MVENQQSVKSILSFGAKSVEPGILEKMLIGRDKSASLLTRAVKSIAEKGNNQHILIIGQRGMGKTHLIRILFHRAQEYLKNNDLKIAYFSEEEYGVSSFFDFLTRILFAFIRWNDNDRVFLQEKLEVLQNTDSSRQTYLLEQIIKDYIGDKPLLILVENFGDILNSIGSVEQGKLRAWLYENKRISIIATSQSISDDFDREDRPFYSFFNFYYLKSLTLQETSDFLISLAEIDQREDVKQHLLSKGKGQVRAIYALVKGNHRLLVTFYDFLKSDTVAKVSKHFIKTINDLKPYYETYIRYLSPQQQKVMRFIALSRKPQMGIVIARNCFIDQKTLSKQLSELVRKKLLDAVPDYADKRNKLYDISEPLLRISIEVGEHKEGVTALFVDFLALYYDEGELIVKKTKFEDLLKSCASIGEEELFKYEITAIEKALNAKKAAKEDTPLMKSLLTDVVFNDDVSMDEALKIIEVNRANLAEVEFIELLLVLHSYNHEFERVYEIGRRVENKNLISVRGLAFWALAIFELAKKSDDEKLFKLAIEKFQELPENNNFAVSAEWPYGEALCIYGQMTDNRELVFKGANKLINASERISDSVLLQITAIEWGMFSIDDDTRIIPKLRECFKRVSKLDIGEPLALLKMWAGVLAYIYELFDDDYLGVDSFREYFQTFDVVTRIQCWKELSKFSIFHLFQYMWPDFKVDLAKEPEELDSVLIDWYIRILANKRSPLQEKDLLFLQQAVDGVKELIPECAILLIYGETYLSYILKGEKNSLYELTKEQRDFFEKNILNSEYVYPEE